MAKQKKAVQPDTRSVTVRLPLTLIEHIDGYVEDVLTKNDFSITFTRTQAIQQLLLKGLGVVK